MIKRKLPKDWIAVNSKSHPDRIYYFNVKTNQSSWMQPTLNEADKVFYFPGFIFLLLNVFSFFFVLFILIFNKIFLSCRHLDEIIVKFTKKRNIAVQ